MFKIHTHRDSESVREVLRRLVATRERASGSIQADTFRLRRNGSWSIFYGRIVSDPSGTFIYAWAFPHWGMILWTAVWYYAAIYLAQAPQSFIIPSVVVVVSELAMEIRRGYNLLRHHVDLKNV